MVRTIHKIHLKGDKTQVIELPLTAEVIKVAIQNNKITLWFIHDENNHQVKDFTFNIYGTGWAVQSENDRYIDTVFKDGFVWHIFEKVTPSHTLTPRD